MTDKTSPHAASQSRKSVLRKTTKHWEMMEEQRLEDKLAAAEVSTGGFGKRELTPGQITEEASQCIHKTCLTK